MTTVPFDDQQAMDWGQCLEPSVQPELRVLSNDSVKGVASGMSTNEATVVTPIRGDHYDLPYWLL